MKVLRRAFLCLCLVLFALLSVEGDMVKHPSADPRSWTARIAASRCSAQEGERPRQEAWDHDRGHPDCGKHEPYKGRLTAEFIR